MADQATGDATLEAIGEKPEGAGPGGGSSLANSAQLAKKWQVEIAASRKWMERFSKAARDCEKAYLDRSPMSDAVVRTYAGKTNLFWSNVQVILSAIYGRLPKAEVDRKFTDFDDDVARVAGIIMQRILNGDIEREHDDTNASMRDAVQDRFVSGLGQVWVRYDVDTETTEQPVLDPLTGQPAAHPETGEPLTQPVEKILNEEAEVDYVYWDDFLYSPCRRWRECRWVARRVYLSEPKLKARFNLTDEQVASIPMRAAAPTDNKGDRQDDVLKATPFKQAAVWEIWDKDSNSVCWYVETCPFVLDYQPDPLELDDFFPCPQPVVATTLTKAFIPRPDYAMAQDLYKELDRINSKLSHLTDAVKAAGVYDKNAAGLKNLMTTAVENALIPVDNWSVFAERGGLKGAMDWMPIEQYVNAIVQLNQRKQQLQADLYEVLGISDIMRGASVASETATAQQLKVQYGGARLSNLQNEVARFVSATMRIRANIICNVFQPETIIERSQIMRTPDAPFAQQAVELLKNFGTAMFRIVVTSDTLAAPDWAAEKDARTEFLGATSNYIMSAGPVMQGNPQMGAFMVKLLQWAAAGFKGAKGIEGVLDQAARQLEQQAQTPPAPKPPTPEDNQKNAQADKYTAEAEKTRAETALLPKPIPLPGVPGVPNLSPPGANPGVGMPIPGAHPFAPPTPQGSGPGAPPGLGQPLPAAPGTVAPLTPQAPLGAAPLQ
jgi:hypothetical protein